MVGRLMSFLACPHFQRIIVHIVSPIIAHRSIKSLCIMVFCATFFISPSSAQAATQLWLPTPPGEPWKIIQGYACGTHNSWDRYSLDFAHAQGATYGAPVRASADGTIWIWVPHSGTLILKHNDGFYTMYTHLASVVTTQNGLFVPRGTVIGAVGDRGSPGVPHLHFTAFTATGLFANNRLSIPLTFADGYHLPETGGCNQHGGSILMADPNAPGVEPGINFAANVEVERWYSGNESIEFNGLGMIRGHSIAWNQDPGGEEPGSVENYGKITLTTVENEGLHTLFVRGWGIDGEQSVETFGPIGFDQTPPTDPQLPTTSSLVSQYGNEVKIQWDASQDEASGVAGYRIYIGPDADGTSDWFTPVSEVTMQELPADSHILRIQALDFAGNEGEWITLSHVISR
ncbi:MAG: M23 family metallopeptidase [Chloroflexi bacterium AL-W]|nr:M23 family metallopeptidase [Chloroflexi bacterium AL-N1]NOK66982.1 M23 family metallopeptidase [Chloroflexi bacterium AL-N10]NOK74726.1 M23 family metallopeptidase [Chloroflexi bacterium AL-N5]NOK81584.1 M23 family metallopeptidase [Chloroflexi bacterium AL-W]NOK89054.1 M23 family metallopeptidase [Chloroflexi bacterium AL-N15]